MTDYNDGKIHGWNGGECPVHPESVVQYWLRSGRSGEDAAGLGRWTHNNAGGDIIAFCVAEAYTEPKTIWVNEYPDGRLKAYNSEIGARDDARNNIVQPPRHCIAVEYREVKK